MIKLRPASERGHAQYDWLDTWHTFSFNTYYDAAWSGFRQLRVINDDTVAPGGGFGMHPHHDMEIITYILKGALEHKDSMGHGSVIRPGDIQRMSAGTGVMHSEFNPSKADPVHLLQIWIHPREKGLQPSYEQIHVERDQKLNQLHLVASPDGADGSVIIQQDAKLFASILEKGKKLTYEPAPGRYAWLQVAAGSVTLGDDLLSTGDGAAISDEPKIELGGVSESELLLFDLA